MDMEGESGFSAPRVSVIIASYNGLEHLRVCLPSVCQSTYPDLEIVVCDDCSSDGSADYLQAYAKKEPRLRVLRNDHNRGAAGTRNQAVLQATGDVFVFLDNDTRVELDWLQALVAVVCSGPDVGAAQAALMVFEEPNRVQLTGVELLPQTCWGVPLEQGVAASARALGSREIVALSTATAVRRDVFERVGGFDEKLAVYTEDLEFSWRIWIAGYRILSAPRAVVYHRGSKDRTAMGGSSRHIYFHMAKNTLRSVTKNHAWPRLLRYLPCAFVILGGRACFRLAMGDGVCFGATARAVGWYVRTLSDTWRARRFVQSVLRKRPDRDIAAAVFSRKGLLGMIAYYTGRR